MRDFQFPGRSPTYATGAMVATSHALASEAALAILRAGGTAADAAVAAVAVLSVVEPHQVSPAGDCFFLVKPPGRPVEGYNGSGRAAKAASVAALREKGLTVIPQRDVHAVTVPGAVDAWAALAERHGRFELGRLFERAVALAADGHPVAPRSALDWAVYAPVALQDPGFRRHHLIDGRAPAPGEVHRQPALAATLRLIAARGPRVMYDGEVAEDMLATLSARGSLLQADDFAGHRGEWVTPAVADYRGRDIVQIPPNGQGIAAHLILRIIETFDVGRHGPVSAERFHVELEAARLGYDARDRFVGEPAAMTVSPRPSPRVITPGRSPAASTWTGGSIPRAFRSRRRTRTPSISRSSIATAWPCRSSPRCSRSGAPASSRRRPASCCRTAARRSV